MEKLKFTDKSLGRLKEITINRTNDCAFIPYPLPKSWNIPQKIWPLLAEAREELGRLDGIGRHMPNYELLLRPLQRREALRSSSLEGTYATPEQLLLYERNPKEPKSQRDPVNSWKEVANYSNAIRLGQKMLNDLPISLRFIREIHKKLLAGVRGHERQPGEFRRTQVHIGSDRRFIPPPAPETLELLNGLELYLHESNDIDPLIFCFMVHYQFETIHPFLDGNGRVGRLLLSLMIYQYFNLNKPWLYLSAYFDRYKDEYIDNLFNVSAKGDWESWISFCLRGTVSQARDAINRFDKLVELRERYLTTISQKGGSIRLNKIIDELFEYPVISVPQIAEVNRISYPTAKSDIVNLVNAGILDEFNVESRPKLFLADEIFDIAFLDFADD